MQTYGKYLYIHMYIYRYRYISLYIYIDMSVQCTRSLLSWKYLGKSPWCWETCRNFPCSLEVIPPAILRHGGKGGPGKGGRRPCRAWVVLGGWSPTHSMGIPIVGWMAINTMNLPHIPCFARGTCVYDVLWHLFLNHIGQIAHTSKQPERGIYFQHY